MQKADLAQELRMRQHALGEVPGEMIETLSDDGIIASYITCACCGEKQVTPKQLKRAIFMAKDADGFFRVCAQLARPQP